MPHGEIHIGDVERFQLVVQLLCRSERSDRGYLMPAVTDSKLCVGCMMCERICPDLCISVIKE